jgi:transposase
MSNGVRFVVDFLEERLGKRITMQVIYILLLLFNVERKVIREVFGASDVTLCKYNAAIRSGDLTSVFEQTYRQPQSELEAYREQIELDFEKNPPATRREAAIRIEEITGISRSLPRIGKFLKKGALKAER